MVNGYKRNTQVAVTKALRVPGTTNVRMFVWKCPNPNLRTKDAQVAAWQKEYLGH